MMKIPGILIRISRMDQSRKLTDLAFQCHISASYLSQIETGKAQPDPQILRQLAKALDLDYTIDQNWLLRLVKSWISSSAPRCFPTWMPHGNRR